MAVACAHPRLLALSQRSIVGKNISQTRSRRSWSLPAITTKSTFLIWSTGGDNATDDDVELRGYLVADAISSSFGYPDTFDFPANSDFTSENGRVLTSVLTTSNAPPARVSCNLLEVDDWPNADDKIGTITANNSQIKYPKYDVQAKSYISGEAGKTTSYSSSDQNGDWKIQIKFETTYEPDVPPPSSDVDGRP